MTVAIHLLSQKHLNWAIPIVSLQLLYIYIQSIWHHMEQSCLPCSCLLRKLLEYALFRFLNQGLTESLNMEGSIPWGCTKREQGAHEHLANVNTIQMQMENCRQHEPGLCQGRMAPPPTEKLPAFPNCFTFLPGQWPFRNEQCSRNKFDNSSC